MWIELDRQIGKVAMERGHLSNEDFIQILRSRENPTSLLLILLERDYFSSQEGLSILEEALGQVKPATTLKKKLMEGLVISREAQDRRLLNSSEEKNKVIFTLLREIKVRDIWEVMKKLFPQRQEFIEAFRQKFSREFLVCPHCFHPQNLKQWEGSGTLTCRQCALPLAISNAANQTPLPWGGESKTTSPEQEMLREAGFLPPEGQKVTSEEETRLQLNSQPALTGNQEAVSRYIVLNRLGEGGMGIVLEAMDTHLRRRVAIKLLRDDVKMDEKNVARFIHEAKATARLGHPNIVQVHDLGYSPDESAYFTMRVIKGVPLSDIIERLKEGDPITEEKYTLNRLLNIFISVCQALSFAHSKGVLHRDIKPENVMVGEFGEVQVMDWGLAKIKGIYDIPFSTLHGSTQKAPLTMAGTLIGTPAYMSPEQASAQNESIDERSDLYSLGMILYEILTLELPFPLGDLNNLLKLIATTQAPSPMEKAPHRKIPKELNAICMKALKLEPEERYQTPGELAEDIQDYLEGNPVSVLEENWWDKGRRFFLRHRFFTLSGITVALIISLALTFFLFQNRWEQIRREKKTLEGRLRTSQTDLQKRNLALHFYLKALEMKQNQVNLHLRLRTLSRAIEKDPHFFPPYVERGKIYEKRGYVKKAFADYKSALEKNPKDSHLLYLTGRFLERHGGEDLPPAEEYFKKAYSMAPHSPYGLLGQAALHLSQKEYEKGISRAEEALSAPQGSTLWEGHLLIATCYLKWSKMRNLAKMKKALAALQKMESLRKLTNPRLLYKKGYLNFLLGHYPQAKLDFEVAASLLRPHHDFRYFCEAWYHFLRREEGPLIQKIDKIANSSHKWLKEYQLEIDFLKGQAYYIIFRRPGHHRKFAQRAKKIFNRILKKSPDHLLTVTSKAELLIKTNRLRQAQKLVDRVWSKNATLPILRLTQAHIYLHQGRRVKAQSLLNELKKDVPEHPQTQILQGEYFFHKKDIKKVLFYYQKAGQLGDSRGYFSAGQILYRKGESEKALKFFRQASQMENSVWLNGLIQQIEKRRKKK